MDRLLCTSALVTMIVSAVGETCYKYSYGYNYQYSSSFECDSACCGYTGYEYCCLSGASIFGIVFGCLVPLALIVAVVLLCVRHHKRKNVMVRQGVVPASTTVAVVSNTGQNASYPQQTYPQQTYPQQTYPQQTYPQQTYPPNMQYPNYNPGVNQQPYYNNAVFVQAPPYS